MKEGREEGGGAWEECGSFLRWELGCTDVDKRYGDDTIWVHRYDRSIVIRQQYNHMLVWASVIMVKKQNNPSKYKISKSYKLIFARIIIVLC